MIRFVDATKVYSNGVVGLKNLTLRMKRRICFYNRAKWLRKINIFKTHNA